MPISEKQMMEHMMKSNELMMHQMIELGKQNQLLMQQMILMMENQRVETSVSSMVVTEPRFDLKKLVEMPGEEQKLKVLVKKVEDNENKVAIGKQTHLGKILCLQLFHKSNETFTVTTAENPFENIDKALGCFLPTVKEKINVPILLKVNRETSAPQLFDEMPMRNERFSYGFLKLLFDPGIDGYSYKYMFDRCWLIVATPLEARDLWKDGVQVNYEKPSKESMEKGKSGQGLDFNSFKDVALVLVKEYAYGVISKGLGDVSDSSFEWIIAWVLVKRVSQARCLQVTEWLVAWVAQQSTRREERSPTPWGQGVLKGDALL